MSSLSEDHSKIIGGIGVFGRSLRGGRAVAANAQRSGGFVICAHDCVGSAKLAEIQRGLGISVSLFWCCRGWWRLVVLVSFGVTIPYLVWWGGVDSTDFPPKTNLNALFVVTSYKVVSRFRSEHYSLILFMIPGLAIIC